MIKKEINEGFSLIEMLVVLVVFSILIILATQAVFLTLRSAKKAENLVKVRQNLDNAMGVIERGLRSASEIDCTEGNPANSDRSVQFNDTEGNTLTYVCDPGKNIIIEYLNDPDGGKIRQGNLTSDEISVDCSSRPVFDCEPNEFSAAPPKVTIDLEARSKGSSGAESATVSTHTQVYLRLYDYQ